MEATLLNYVYGKASCRWGSPDGTVWAFEPLGYVLVAWDTTVGAPRVAEPVAARPVVTSGASAEVQEPVATATVPQVSFSGWQAVNVLGDATRIALEDRTAAVTPEDSPAPPVEESPK